MTKFSSLSLKTVLLSFVFIYFSANAQDNEEISVTAKGSAKIVSSKQEAKDEALREAFSNALKGRVESLVGKEKFSVHYELIDNNILKKGSKFTSKYTMKKQEQIGKQFEVEVQLSIDVDKLKEALASIGLLFTETEYYKGLLLVSVNTLLDSTPDFWWGKDMEERNKGIIGDILAKPEITNPIVLMDPFKLDLRDKLPRDLTKIFLSNEEVQSIGKIVGADIIFYGSMSSKKELASSETVNLTVMSSMQAYNVKTGRIISHTSFTGKNTTPVNQINENEKALFVQTLSQNLMKAHQNIVATWVSGTFNSTNYRITIHGSLSYKDFGELKLTLKKEIKAITQVADYVISKNKKTISIESNKSLDEIKTSIRTLKFDNFSLEPKESNESETIELIIKRL